MIKPGVQKWQIQDEINGETVTGSRCRQPFAFEHDVGTRNVLSQPVPQHEPDIRVFNGIPELDGDPYADAVALRYTGGRFAFSAVDTYTRDVRLSIAVPVIHVWNVLEKFRNSRQRFVRELEVGRSKKRLPKCFLFHDLFSSSSHHRGKVF